MKSEKDIKRIFSDKDAFRREVSLARVQIEGLGDEDLASALAYELEPYSKIPAADAEVAWKEVPGSDPAMKIFDTAVVRRRAGNGAVTGAEKYVKPLGFLAAAVIAAIACDRAYLAYRSDRIAESLASRAPLQASLDKLSSRAAGMKRRAAEIRSAREASVAAQNECARLRAAYPGFLDALSSTAGKAVVKSVSKGDGEFSQELVFAAVDGDTGSGVMQLLTREMAKRGWELETGDISGGAVVEIKAKARFRQ